MFGTSTYYCIPASPAWPKSLRKTFQEHINITDSENRACYRSVWKAKKQALEWPPSFHQSKLPSLLSHCAGCLVVRCRGMDHIQCANWQTASVCDKTFKINGYLLERLNQQWWGAEESWAILMQMNPQWLGHLERMNWQILYTQLQEEKQNQGCSLKIQ